MPAILLSVGDELILGQTVDTNSAWLSQQLASIGLPVIAHITVADDQNAIEQAIRESIQRAQFLIITGGIGPTPDDLTRQALAAVTQAPFELNEDWLTKLKGFWAKRGHIMPEMNRIQAMIPKGAKLINNPAGTAAGIHAILGNRQIFVLPGVPKEMKLMFERSVLPPLRDSSGGGVILSKTLHTFGLGESKIAEMLGPLMDRTRNPSVGTTVSNGIVSVRVNARSSSIDQARRELDATVRECHGTLGAVIFGEEDETLPKVVLRLLKSRSSLAQTITTAESCTGGLLAKMITDIPGSSTFFRQGFVTYSNDAKQKLLKVPFEQLQLHGAVSEPVVQSMARAALADGDTIALAISGVAGPEGGTPTKPVGTVCIALAERERGDFPQALISKTFLFPGDREMIRDRSAKMALTMLRFHLLGKPLPF